MDERSEEGVKCYWSLGWEMAWLINLGLQEYVRW